MLIIAEKSREELTNTLLECSHIDSIDESYYKKQRDAKTPEANMRFDINSENAIYWKSNPDSKSPIANKAKSLLNDKPYYNSSTERGNEKWQNFGSHDLHIRKMIQKCIGKEIKSIQRIKDYSYKINNSEINLAVCDDGIFVKNGNLLIPLKGYGDAEKRHNSKTIINKLDLQKLPSWTDKDTENDYKKQIGKISPRKNFLKSTESSQKKLKIHTAKSISKNFTKIFSNRINN